MSSSADRFVHRPNVIDRFGQTVIYAGELLRHPCTPAFSIRWSASSLPRSAVDFGIYCRRSSASSPRYLAVAR